MKALRVLLCLILCLVCSCALAVNYYHVQLAIWNAHYGSPSVVVLNHAQNALADQCSMLCIFLSGVI